MSAIGRLRYRFFEAVPRSQRRRCWNVACGGPQSPCYDCPVRTTTDENSSTKLHGVEATLPKLKLLMVGGTAPFQTPRPYALPAGVTELGREPTTQGALIIADDRRLSRTHARLQISRDGRSAQLFDLNSRNGSWVNRQAVPSTGVTLRDGDVIRVGDSLLLFRREPAKPPDAEIAELHGTAPGMAQLRHRLMICAADRAPLFMFGETGTGKERAARAVHRLSKRGPWMPVNCGAESEGLGAEAFLGHDAGAYTGAVRGRVGYFAAADGGTLFLDEVTELSPKLQPVLLRLLAEGEVTPLGRNGTLRPQGRVDVRVICASNRDLAAEVTAGRFREDLYWRLCHLRVELPPLRERREDILSLLLHSVPEREFPRSVQICEAILCHSFPGNIRTLQAIAAELRTFGPDELLFKLNNSSKPPSDPPSSLAEPPESRPQPYRTTPVSKGQLEAALRQTEGNMSAAALVLSISRAQIYVLARKFGIAATRFREETWSTVHTEAPRIEQR